MRNAIRSIYSYTSLLMPHMGCWHDRKRRYKQLYYRLIRLDTIHLFQMYLAQNYTVALKVARTPVS